MAPSWDVSPSPNIPHDFTATLRLKQVGGCLVHDGTAGPQRIRRTLRRARADGQDHYMAVQLRTGCAIGDAGGVAMVWQAGEFRIFDLARSLDIVMTGSATRALYVHRDALDLLVAQMGPCHGRLLSATPAALLEAYLEQAASISPLLTPTQAELTSRASALLLAACLTEPDDDEAPPRLPLHIALARRARVHVDANLADRSLSADRLAPVLGVSRSGLYRLMEPYGGVTAFVQRRRLARVHAILSDPQDQRRIAQLALSHGFANETHFSRAFRKQYGYAPSDIRNGIVASRPTNLQAGEVAQVYRQWMLAG